MAMGIPVITNSGVGDVKKIVLNHRAGFVVDDFTESSFSKVIDAIKVNPQFDRKAIREAAINTYGLQIAEARYRSVYLKVLGD